MFVLASDRVRCTDLLCSRAYWLTITNQRWIGVRIDMLGLLLTFVVAILTVAGRFSISPSQTGVTLSYIISVQQSLGWMIRQVAELENDMNSVERIIHYSKNLEQEPPHEIPDKKPKDPWPSEGRVEIKDVYLKYRPELPDVLRGLSMDVAPAEKIGIVGRTGAGKSSIMTALYRLVELSAGSILIDGVDISKIGLKDLRSSLAIIPQDPVCVLFRFFWPCRSSIMIRSCCSLARCGPIWILSINSTTPGSGMPLSGRISWTTRNKIQQMESKEALLPDGSPSTPLLRTRGAICLLDNVRWFPLPGLW